MPFTVETMQPADYDAVHALWKQSEGVGLTPSDDRGPVLAFLARNPGLSLVARRGEELIGTVLAGHDGRRGFLYHLAVSANNQRQGVARALVAEALARLAGAGVPKASIFVFRDNEPGLAFWRAAGWNDRLDLIILQHATPA